MSAEGFWNVQAFSGNSTIAVRPPIVEHEGCIRFMLEDLAKSGLTPQDLDTYPVAPDRTTMQYVIPYPQEGMYRTKRDDPKFKYKSPKGRNEVWYSSKQDYNSFRSAPILLIVEGEKKAARAVKEWPHIPVLAIGGVWNGTLKQADGSHRLHDVILNAVAPGQSIKLIFDNDILERDDLQKAAFTLYSLLERQNCRPELCVPPSGTKGLDDYLVHRDRVKLPYKDIEEVGLVQVPFEDLAPTRSALIEELGLDTNSDGGIIISSINYARLLKHFINGKIKYDKRLGFLTDDNKLADPEKIRLDFIAYIESRLRLKNITIYIDYAWSVFVHDSTVDALIEEIRSVKWDGVPRLDTWGGDYIPNKHDYREMSNEWGRLLITAMGMRLLEPGTKFDYVMFLVGPQGTYKTTFFESLAQFKCGRFYGTIEKIGTDDGARRTLGAKARRNIILDFSESTVLDGRATSVESLKSFVTMTEDEFREVYAKVATQLPRSFILVGTSNKHNQLYDTTGSRRFAMLDVKDTVKPIPYDVKLQLLAEVFATAPQIKRTAWWEFRLKWDDLPPEIISAIETDGYTPNANLSEGNQIIEAFNQSHIKEDPNITELKFMLSSPDDNFATYHHAPGQYVTTMVHLMGVLQLTKKEVTYLIRRIQDDPHFPWTFTRGTTLQISSLEFPPGMTPAQYNMTAVSGVIQPWFICAK